MNVLSIFSKYFRYFDQAIYSLSTLLLSILAPLFFFEDKAAEILYLISFLLLFLAGITAFFVTPILSLHDDSNNLVSKIFKLFSCVFVFGFLTVFSLKIFLDIENIYFYYFCFLFCAIELLRRIFIRKDFYVYSFFLSSGMFVLFPLAYFISSSYIFNFWEVLFYLSFFLALLGFFIYKKNVAVKVSLDKSFLNRVFEIGFISMGSFFLMWCATQGIFVVFYNGLEHAIFVEQKVIFSVLGFFNIVMVVQENKYQPLYAKAVVDGDIFEVRNYDRSVNFEGYALLFFCFILFILFYFMKYSFYISFFIFALYRFFLSVSKINVYYIRAIGKFKYLLLANMIALLVIFIVYLLDCLVVFYNYQIPLYFLIHSLVFLITTYFFRSREFYAKHWNI
ncbi:hypothetical protein [Acinetobacter haemolyticus]|uniref:hypothetical protein n=1 Tax=Acinetobacter haemolyticus TaxID=29430 RepID=UPI000F73A489|nr:hypothetical protein [Acinetobacter haemolyticus]RSN75492.1 hypothetical protein EA769_10120 [Acinetobacter haemolyticus]